VSKGNSFHTTQQQSSNNQSDANEAEGNVHFSISPADCLTEAEELGGALQDRFDAIQDAIEEGAVDDDDMLLAGLCTCGAVLWQTKCAPGERIPFH